MKKLFFLPLLLLAFSCSQADEQTSAPQQPMQYGPAGSENINHAEIIESAVFTDLDGNDVTLADFAGQVLVIDFWETWCGPCLQVFPSLQELREEYPDDFHVLAVTLGMMEGPEEARAFRDDHDYDFHYLHDAYNVSEQLGIYSIPFKMYINPDGEMIKFEIGSRGREGDYESAKSVITDFIY